MLGPVRGLAAFTEGPLMSVESRLLIRGVNEQTLIEVPSGRMVEIPVTVGKSGARAELDASGDVLL
jgi:hypothetical protein